MENQLKMVDEFHQAFSIPRRDQPHGKLNPDEFELRFNLMVEENLEYLDACREENIVKIADALGDQLYVLLGTILTHGLQHKIAEVFSEIHRSNMSKLGPDGRPLYREDGKILKSPAFVRPDLKAILDGI